LSESPLIIAHRGASAWAPENTLTAFAQALDCGADGCELDVRLARDGVPVVMHDATLRRTGLRAGEVGRMTSRELAAVGVGDWFNRAHPALASRAYSSERVPTLESVFQNLLNWNPATIYVELKPETRSTSQLVNEVVDLVRRYDLQERVVIVSFELSAIGQIKSLDSAIRTGALFAPRHGAGVGLRGERIISAAVDCGANEILLHRLIARARLVDAAERQGLPVVVWTVDEPAWLQKALKFGLHALITNDPARLLAHRTLLHQQERRA
jgi:glycerophosphoryl diester phosphodiesterase